MRIWLVQPSEQLPLTAAVRKLRTRLLAEELARRGHEVVWWASCFNHLRKQWYFDRDTTFSPAPGVTVHALKSLGYASNVSLRRWADHRLLAKRFETCARDSAPPDIVVTSLPPHDLAAAAVRHAQRSKALSVVDVRDKWPDNFIDVLPKPVRLAARTALGIEFRLRNYALQHADAVLSMTEPLLEWGLRAGDRPRTAADQVFYLGAYREPSTDVPEGIRDLIEQRLRGRFVIAFMGTFSTYHDPTAMIDAAAQLRDRPDVVFVLIGDGDLNARLRSRAADLTNVIFTGWLDSPAIAAILRHSHLGLCTSGSKSEREFLPNKVFGYLAEGVPIGSVFDGELRSLLEAHRFGFSFRTSDELVSAIIRLSSDPADQREMSTAAASFFRERCESSAIYGRYADLLEQIGDSHRMAFSRAPYHERSSAQLASHL